MRRTAGWRRRIPIAWFRREAVIAFFLAQVLRNPEQWCLPPTWGNGQPAIGVFVRHSDGGYRGHGVHVLETSGGLIARVVAFNEAALHLSSTSQTPGSRSDH